MAGTGLDVIMKRIQNLPAFYEALMNKVCQACIQVLRDNTPGTTLPNEWDYTVTRSGDRVEGHIFSRRYERTDEDWESILVWLNLGTRTHWVEPVQAQALHWMTPGGEHAFSEGHMVSGILPALFAESCDRVIARFEGQIQKMFTDYMEKGTLP